MPPAPRSSVTVAGKAMLPGGAMMRNALANPEPAPPPIGAGDTTGPAPAGNPLLGLSGNALAPSSASQGLPPATMAPQQAPAAAMPSQPPPPPDAPEQHLAALGQQLDAANLTPAQVDQHAATYGDAIHHLGALVQKGGAVTHDDVVRQAMYAVQGGSIAPDVAARFVDSMKGPPQQLQSKLKQAVANTMLTNVALASLKQRMGGAAPQGGQLQPNQTESGQP